MEDLEKLKKKEEKDGEKIREQIDIAKSVESELIRVWSEKKESLREELKKEGSKDRKRRRIHFEAHTSDVGKELKPKELTASIGLYEFETILDRVRRKVLQELYEEFFLRQDLADYPIEKDDKIKMKEFFNI